MVKLLIVEDDLLLNEAYRRKFGSIYDLRIEVNGVDGVKAAIAWEPDVIVLDLFLPGKINGLDVLKAVRQEKKLQKTPIMVVTNLPDAVDRVMSLGATKCWMKTDVDLNSIAEDLEELIEKKI